MDSDSYLISSEEDPRKEYVAFRPRLKVFGTPVEALSGMAKGKSSLKELKEVNISAEDSRVQKELSNVPNLKSERGPGQFKLRKDRMTDYRKFFA